VSTESTIPLPRQLAVAHQPRRSMPGVAAGLWTLTKPEINLLIAITVSLSFCLASRSVWDIPLLRLFQAVLGTILVCSGAAALNQFMERRFDGLMRRTARRPVVLGGVSARVAFIFGTGISAIGIVYLYICANPISSFLAAAALGIYLGLYTPLKRVTPLCTLVGAFSGAAPTLIGWAAAAGGLGYGAWILYTILFLWQFPHFMAIAWMYREDYDRAGYRILSRSSMRYRFATLQSVLPAMVLLPCSMIPSFIGFTDNTYVAGAGLLGIAFCYYAVRLASDRSNSAARRLLFASIIYLPSVFLLLVLDKR
jgi:protoheme IX farnesyltransferase